MVGLIARKLRSSLPHRREWATKGLMRLAGRSCKPNRAEEWRALRPFGFVIRISLCGKPQSLPDFRSSIRLSRPPGL
ncbi:hypothetical protein MAMT_00101 [Methylacidimicrobium tartarophylax]|uniref:Uncharacterized protein n=1 Tax=Methylacidimicrobium tartarophylax TaxID=1041768 RepID=A0A5E6M556_9BACT|nr:hypothetical protein MAMT_00101 [Methylacidimicrobium tartarophylax]